MPLNVNLPVDKALDDLGHTDDHNATNEAVNATAAAVDELAGIAHTGRLSDAGDLNTTGATAGRVMSVAAVASGRPTFELTELPATAGPPDASTTVKGIARILGGTADAPTVPWSAVTGAPAIPDSPDDIGAQPAGSYATTAALTSGLAAKADVPSVVTLTASGGVITPNPALGSVFLHDITAADAALASPPAGGNGRDIDVVVYSSSVARTLTVAGVAVTVSTTGPWWGRFVYIQARDQWVLDDRVGAGGPGGGAQSAQRVIVLTEAPYNADPTGVVAFDAAMDAALADLAAAAPVNPTGASAHQGGVIYLPPGYYRQAAAHTIASNSTVVRGDGRQAAHIFLDPAFPINTPAWDITGTGTVFDSRLEHLTLNCNDVAGSVGVKTVNGQEGCGLRGVRVRNWKEKGFLALGTGQTSKPAEIVVSDCEFWASGGVSATANGIHFEDTVQQCYVEKSSILTLATNTGGLNAVYLRTTNVHAEDLHIEDFPNGFYVDVDAALSVDSVNSFNGVGPGAGQATIVLPTTTNRCTARNINNGTGNILYDQRAGMTRGGSTFRFLHEYAVDYSNTDVVVGHFGALDVRKTRTAGGPTATALVVKDGTTTSLTASIQQWQDSASAVRAEMYTGGGLRLGLTANAATNWTDGHLQLGPYHLWMDDTGHLRVKSGAPASATDGVRVGASLVHAVGNSGASLTLDAASALGFIKTVTLTANCTVTLTGAITGQESTLELLLTQNGTGGWAVTWPAAVKWEDGPPTLATTAGAINRVVLTSYDGGTTWLGELVGKGYV